MNEENRDKIVKASKGFFPSDLIFQCGDGWFLPIYEVAIYAASKIGRWDEVVEIRDKILASGESIDKYSWIEEYFAQNPTNPYKDTKVSCVKEKFGGLRIYYDGDQDEYIDGLISMAEAQSWRMCEECGSPGRKRSRGGYLYVSCDQHDKGSIR